MTNFYNLTTTHPVIDFVFKNLVEKVFGAMADYLIV